MKNPAEAMRELRLRFLVAPPADFGIQKNANFPRTYGVLMEFPVGEMTATVIGLCDGNASLYTTSAFGVIGGFAHEKVRAAAVNFVKAADKHHESSTPTSVYPYPDSEHVIFYLLTFSGVRVIHSDLDSIESGGSTFSPLFDLGQELLAQLRVTAEARE